MSISAINSASYNQMAIARVNQQESAINVARESNSLFVDKKDSSAYTSAENISSNVVNFAFPLISSGMNATLLAQQEVAEDKALASQTFSANTSKGKTDLNLDEYFPDRESGRVSLLDKPLLLPTPDNIAALSEHSSERFKQVLSEYNIPIAPEKITYNSEGQMQLPRDYPFQDELKQALEDNPGLGRELHTLNSLTSHYVEMQKSAPFQEEYSNAQSSAEIDSIIEKYSHLFQGGANYSAIALLFSEDGDISLMADEESLNFT